MYKNGGQVGRKESRIEGGGRLLTAVEMRESHCPTTYRNNRFLLFESDDSFYFGDETVPGMLCCLDIGGGLGMRMGIGTSCCRFVRKYNT